MEIVGFFVACFRQLLYLRSARVAKPESTRHLVKGFACGIITSTPYELKFVIISNLDNMAVSARSNEADKGRFKIRIGEIIGCYMPFDMVYSDKRQILGERKPFCKAHADKQRTDKPR